MKIMLVEDDENKREHIFGFLKDEFPAVDIRIARSYHSALKCLLFESFDAVILDMTLPTFDKGSTDSAGRLRPLGGKELLDQMYRRDIRSPVIVITGYDMLGEGERAVPLEKVTHDMISDFPGLFLRAIFYSRAEERWKHELRLGLAEILVKGAPK